MITCYPDRREFLLSLSTALLGLGVQGLPAQTSGAAEPPLLGQGAYRWRVVPGWGVLDAETPVKDCHGMLQTKDGRIFLLTNETRNNVIIYSREGKLLDKWGTGFPGAHGFTLAEEDGEERFYITDHLRHQFFKTTLDGTILRTWDYPEASGKYDGPDRFQPTHLALAPDGGFFVVDGYGLNWCHRYDARGEYLSSFGGDQPGGAHLACAHGAWVDTRDPRNLLWITSRSEGKIKRYTLEGALVDVIDLPGSEPNFIVPFGDCTVIPCLRTRAEGSSAPGRGSIRILDADRRILSHLANDTPKSAGEAGSGGGPLFTFPHGLLIDDQESLYVAQWNSGNTYPIKLARARA